MHRIQTNRYARGPLLTVVLAAAAVTACQSDDQAGSEPGAPAAEASAAHEAPSTAAPHSTADEAMEVGYQCADGKSFTVAFMSPEEIRITIDGETSSLARTAGHRLLFTGDNVVFYSEGREASVEIDGVPAFTDCEAQGHPE